MASVNLSTLFRNKLGTMSLESISGLQTALATKVDKSSVSDSVSSTTAGGVSSSAAVKIAYDKGVEAFAKATAALTAANQAATGTTNLPNAKSDSYNLNSTDCVATSAAVYALYNTVVLPIQTTANAASTNAAAALNKWSALPNAKSDSVSLDSTSTLATSAAVKRAYDTAVTAQNTANAASNGIQGAKDYAAGLFNNRSDSVSSNVSSTLATSAAVYAAYNRQHVALYYGGTSKVAATSGGATVSGDLVTTGNITASANVTAYSDRRLKTDITPLTNALDSLLKINGYRFKWKGTGRDSIGVIAQELQEIFPELVIPVDDRLTVDYSLLTAIIIEAIKELNAKLEK